MASAAVMAITKRSISGSEKSVPAKDQQSKRLRHAAIVPSYGALCCVCAPSRPGSLRRASQLKTDKPLERLDTFASHYLLISTQKSRSWSPETRYTEFRRVLSRAARPLPWIKPLFSELLPR